MRRIRNSGIVGEKKKERDNCRTVVLGYMTLERRVFDLSDYLFVSTRITILNSNNKSKEGCDRC